MNLILDKVRRARALTTITDNDLVDAEHGVSRFSVEGAIYGEVQREDLVRWARTPEQPFVPVRPLPDNNRVTTASLYTFMRGVLP